MIHQADKQTSHRQKSTFAFRLHYLYDGASVVCGRQLCIFIASGTRKPEPGLCAAGANKISRAVEPGRPFTTEKH